MSFYYTNPLLAHTQAQAQQQQQQRRYNPAPPFVAPMPIPPFNPFTSGFESYDHADIDEEEQAALAHLRAIQRRKENERLARQEAAREAALAQYRHEVETARATARARAEYEASLRAEALAEAQRQKAAYLERQRTKLEAANRARLVQHQRQRQEQLAAAAALEQLNQDRAQAFANARLARRQTMDEARRQQSARHCAARRCAVHEPAPSQTQSGVAQSEANPELEAFNRWIGSLFGGLQLPNENEKESSNDSTQSIPAAPVRESTPAPAPAAAAAAEMEASPAPAPVPVATAEIDSTAAPQDKPEFPNAINGLLSTFLGLRVEPESKLGEAVSNKVPAGLNEFLNQFGLEFTPDQPKEDKKEKDVSTAGPSTSTDKPTAPPAPAPVAEEKRPNGPVDLADFLSGSHGLPPFVRDILGNVELAFKDRSESESGAGDKEVKAEGKGKGVAEGEKNLSAPATAAAPTPAPVEQEPTAAETAIETEDLAKKASADSLAKLDSIAFELELAKDSFTFPTSLCFAATSNNTESVPSLLYNKQNKPYHAQNNKLLQLLLQADGVASNGDKEVRKRRKALVKLVEGEIELLERKRDEYWQDVRERREHTGEISENESWSTGSSVDHDEVVHVEDVAASAVATSQEGQVPAEGTSKSHSEPEPEHPSSFADAVKATPTEAEDTKVVDENTKQSDKVEKKDKEEGYELL